MPKDIVICCDGTGNEINSTISNVLKLFRVLEKDANQRVYYHPGVGTIGLQSTWERLKQEAYGVFSLATGAGSMRIRSPLTASCARPTKAATGSGCSGSAAAPTPCVCSRPSFS
jgi:hypothetical protein